MIFHDQRTLIPRFPSRQTKRGNQLHAGELCSVAYLEDPFTDPLTEPVTFHGGCFQVMPGMLQDGAFILQRICDVLFLNSDASVSTTTRETCQRIIATILAISNEVVRRIKWRRYHPCPDSSECCVVPQSEQLKSLQRAIEFTPDEITELLKSVGASLEDMRRFTISPGAATFTAPNNHSLCRRPIVEFDDSYVVTSPCRLLSALRLELFSYLQEQSSLVAAARHYRDSVFDLCLGCLEAVGFDFVIATRSALAGEEPRQAIMQFDSDKFLSVVLITDMLSSPSVLESQEYWETSKLVPLIKSAMLEAENLAFTEYAGINEILHLIVVQDIGRGSSFGFGKKLPPIESNYIVLSASELEQLTHTEDFCRLTLWQFATSKEELRSHARVISMSMLEEYYWWRSKGRTFCPLEKELPNLMTFLP